MNEITRIHLAKVAYDVDIVAKKHLEKYIKELESYTGDGEVLTDVEIRMTELLADRKVMAGGVITNDDVEAIRAQLGEPYEFAEESGDIAVGPADHDVVHPRRFYRDLHGALLGGVLSGIAMYLKVDALWVRIAFIILLFISFGTASFVYLILWAIIPPAHTATQRLRQEGRPATVQAIRSLNEHPAQWAPNTTAPTMRRALSVLLGVVSLLCAVGVAAVLAMGVAALVVGAPGWDIGVSNVGPWVATVVGGLVVLGLALLITLLSLIAYSFFTQKLTKRMVISGIVIVVLGMVAFTGTLGTFGIQSWQTRTQAERSLRHTAKMLPANFTQVTSLHIVSQNDATSAVPIRYIVDNTPHYDLTALPGVKMDVKVNGTDATISLTLPHDARNSYVQSQLTIYGPALTTIADDNTSLTYSPQTQDSLAVTVKQYGNVTVDQGTVQHVTAMGVGTIDFASATVSELTVDGEYGLVVSAGTVRTLAVTLPDSCPSGDESSTSVSVSGVTSGSYTYNNTKHDAASYQTNCATVTVGDDNDNF